MSEIAHFIVLRKDLPLGTALAMVCHAAGESAFLSWKLPSSTTAIILGVDSQAQLIETASLLSSAGVEYVPIEEPSHPWNGELMAIGIVPGSRDGISPYLTHLKALKELTFNPQPAPDSALKSSDDFNGPIDTIFETSA